MESLLYVVHGDPVPLLRARYGKSRVYNTQGALRLFWTVSLTNIHEELPLLKGPLHMDITLYMPVPQSYTAKKQQSLYGQPHAIRPDLSNMVKWVEDCCKQIVFHDDCAIASTYAKKLYIANPTDLPRTEFKFRTIKGDQW